MDKRERVARAIARDGFGRDWDDFLPVNANDTDQGDLMEYAQAAIAALEPVTVQEAEREGARSAYKAILDLIKAGTPIEGVKTVLENNIRALAEKE